MWSWEPEISLALSLWRRRVEIYLGRKFHFLMWNWSLPQTLIRYVAFSFTVNKLQGTLQKSQSASQHSSIHQHTKAMRSSFVVCLCCSISRSVEPSVILRGEITEVVGTPFKVVETSNRAEPKSLTRHSRRNHGGPLRTSEEQWRPWKTIKDH